MQHCVRFNPIDVRDIVSNGKRKVIFWNWTDEHITAFHPPKGTKKLKANLGALTQTCFIPYTTKAVTATMSSHVVLWNHPVSDLEAGGRDAIKIMKLTSSSGISLIDTVADKFVVTGGADGAVRFFDFQFRVVGWFEDIQQGPVTSISFAANMSRKAKSTNGEGDGEVASTFSVPDFVVATELGKVIHMESPMVNTHTRTYTHAHTHNSHPHTHAHVHTYTHTDGLHKQERSAGRCVGRRF
jgi:WD40 repeat protein